MSHHVGYRSDSIAISQQFTYGVVWEGVIAENVRQISTKFPQAFAEFPHPFSRSASGGCLQGGASFKVEKAHFAA